MLIRYNHSIQFFVALLTLVASAQFGEAQPQRRGIPAPEESVIPSDPVDIQMHRFNRLPAIDATINGKGPFRLIVDTGAAGLILESAVAKIRPGRNILDAIEHQGPEGVEQFFLPVLVECPCAEASTGSQPTEGI